MSANARTVLPTDLVALVSYDGRVYSNEAMTRDRIGTQASPHPLEAAFEQWFSFATGRHTWISVKGPTLRGLVSARKRGSKLAWEMDCLIDAAGGDNGVLMSLLDQMTEAAGKSGALRIFLRLPAGSYSERAVSRCGFMAYTRERLYRAESERLAPRQAPVCLRRQTKADLYSLFRLYNQCVPDSVRRHEAMTLAEWMGAQEGIGGRAAQWVLEDDGAVRGWLRFAGDGGIGRFDAVSDADSLDGVLDAAMAKLSNRRSIYTLVAEHQRALRWRLEALGFQPGEEYTVFARRTVRLVKAPRAKPVLAQTALG